MAGPWEKYQQTNQSADGPWAKYSGSAEKADFSDVQSSVSKSDSKPQVKRAATRHSGQYGITPYLMDFADSTAHHAMNALHGGAQAVQHGAKWLVNKAIDAPQRSLSDLVTGNAPAPQTLPQRFRQYVNDSVAADDAALRSREEDYQARTETNPSSVLGAGIGEALPWLTGTRALAARGLLPTVSANAGRVSSALQKGGLLAAEGGLMGLTTPVTEDGDYGAQKGTQVVTGAAAAPLIAAGVTGTGATLNAARRAGRYLTDTGRDAIANEKVLQLLGGENLPALRGTSGTPGFAPTPAQVIGTPEAVQAERVLRNDARSAPFFAQQESANNEALRNTVAELAGTDQAMAAARASRSAATDPYYAKLPGAKADPAPVLTALDQLENSSLGVNKNVKAAVASLKNEIKSRLDSEGKLPADVLSGLHSEAGSHLGPMASAQEKKALGPVRDSIANALDAAVPGYRDTVAAYARLSQPISDMQAGRAVLDAIDSGARDAGGNQAVSLNQIKAALAKDAKAKFPMSPQARKQLEAVRDALQQRSITNNTVAASGPGTAADVMRGGAGTGILRLLGQGVGTGLGFGGGGLPAYLLAQGVTEGTIAARNSVAKKVGEKASNSMRAADAIEAAQRDQARRKTATGLQKYLLPYRTD